MEDAVAAILEKNIDQKRPHKVVKSATDRYAVCCKDAGCLSNVCVRKRGDGLFHVSSFHVHTCECLFPEVKTDWIRARAKEQLAVNPTTNSKSLQNTLRAEFGVSVPPWLSRRGMVKARASIAKDEEGFGKLRPFLDALRNKNAGTRTDVIANDGCLFRAFLCPGACSSAFQHSLKVLGIDGCHGKTKHGGVLLVATALDGNKSIFPVAVGVAEVECIDAWSWFLRNLRDALSIGGGDGIVILSDMEKGIERSVGDVLPGARHGFCLRHMEKNLCKHFASNFDGFLWKAAKCVTEEDFDDCIAAMRGVNPAAADYISAIPAEKGPLALWRATVWAPDFESGGIYKPMARRRPPSAPDTALRALCAQRERPVLPAPQEVRRDACPFIPQPRRRNPCHIDRRGQNSEGHSKCRASVRGAEQVNTELPAHRQHGRHQLHVRLPAGDEAPLPTRCRCADA